MRAKIIGLADRRAHAAMPSDSAMPSTPAAMPILRPPQDWPEGVPHVQGVLTALGRGDLRRLGGSAPVLDVAPA